MTSDYKRPLCPACQNPLNHSIEMDGRGTHVVYCGVGRCPAKASNEGAEGATLDEAMEKLTKAIEEEMA